MSSLQLFFTILMAMFLFIIIQSIIQNQIWKKKTDSAMSHMENFENTVSQIKNKKYEMDDRAIKSIMDELQKFKEIYSL